MRGEGQEGSGEGGGTVSVEKAVELGHAANKRAIQNENDITQLDLRTLALRTDLTALNDKVRGGRQKPGGGQQQGGQV